MASIFDDFPRGVPGRAGRNAPLATASWSADAPLYHEGALYLGLDDKGRDVGYADDRHAVTVAGSRAGKGRSVIIPNLFRWPGSCAVTDPKGENATRTAVHRSKRRGHKVAVVDPCRTADIPNDLRVTFNPVDLIDAESDDSIDLAAAIGDAVMIGSGDGKDMRLAGSPLRLTWLGSSNLDLSFHATATTVFEYKLSPISSNASSTPGSSITSDGVSAWCLPSMSP